jgi:hypothetical protein
MQPSVHGSNLEAGEGEMTMISMPTRKFRVIFKGQRTSLLIKAIGYTISDSGVLSFKTQIWDTGGGHDSIMANTSSYNSDEWKSVEEEVDR